MCSIIFASLSVLEDAHSFDDVIPEIIGKAVRSDAASVMVASDVHTREDGGKTLVFTMFMSSKDGGNIGSRVLEVDLDAE